MNLNELPRSQTMRAVNALRDLIFTGALPAGSSYLESELADRLFMSRTPIREAGLILEAQGLVDVRPRRGMRVKSLSVADVEDIYDILIALEARASEQVANKHYSVRELIILADAVEDMAGAVARGDRVAWAETDEAFCTELLRLSGNERLASIAATCTDQLRRIHMMTMHLRPLPDPSDLGHAAHYRALAQGDIETALAVHRAYRQRSKEVVSLILEQFALKQF
ncbi:GntR family transcriptional regulator [Cohaesibacter celericrescens]|uniref:GntR family transcriptional regulator n=1 Tax=Cohaesibacter celericrescens TaxID=2067669 RepID=A0A2N5XU16_9HYPH|nr:GntR family transcriptional regulator [Cohaesibacter celericrescens]PLW78003.1 GntR family transcriptional regulator [Cohaesibacter celericrescens]